MFIDLNPVTDFRPALPSPPPKWSQYVQSNFICFRQQTYTSLRTVYFLKFLKLCLQAVTHDQMFPLVRFHRMAVTQVFAHVCSEVPPSSRAESWVLCTRNRTVSDSDTYLKIDTHYTGFWYCKYKSDGVLGNAPATQSGHSALAGLLSGHRYWSRHSSWIGAHDTVLVTSHK